MSKIVKGYWDCPYCNNKGISGLEKRCTACGHPQDEGTKFYLKEQKEYVSEEKAGEYGKGADWTCSYCGSLNRHDAKVCVGCGADREESSGDYFENVEKQKKKVQQKAEQEKPKQPEPKTGIKRFYPFIIGLAVLIAIMAFACRPRNYGASVTDKAWARAIDVEVYKTVSESDWSVPDGGRVTDERDEIHHYDDVLDHYETVTVEKSRQVEDGYDTHTEYDDNGDGTFTEREVQTPRYKTEYYTEEEERPVYKQVPRYQTKYYYDIDKWVPDRTLETSGGTDTPYWDDTVLSENERESDRRAEYKVTFTTDKDKTYTAEVDEELWNSLNPGDNVDIVVKSGSVTSVNGTEL